MSVKIITDRLRDYSPKTRQEEINALKEIMQDICLSSLSRSEFFKYAAFQGGTCLRIVYALQRFSEDLDFILLKPNSSFSWAPFLENVHQEFSSYNLDLQVIDRTKADRIIQKAFLKQDSFGKILELTSFEKNQKILIKLEIDTNPPGESGFENQIIDFPYPFSIVSQDMPSLFASKCHALLCRPFIKGRDWYDFIWYISRNSKPNLKHLKEALFQYGPWSFQNLDVSMQWLIAELRKKINKIDWNKAKNDVKPFLRQQDLKTLDLWSSEFFITYLNRLV